MNELNSIKTYMRDITLDVLTNHPDIKIDISKRYNNKFRLFYPSRKLIKYVTKIGGVLTGSRALRCYTINGEPILDRSVHDWDFVITLDMAFKICSDMNIDQIPQIGEVISIKNQRMWRHPDYQDSYRVGIVDVQLIVREDLPDFNDIKGVRIASFGYTISQKLSLATELLGGKEYSKHISDLKRMIIKFNRL